MSTSTQDVPQVGGSDGPRPTMKTTAAVIRATGRDWEVVELDLDPPREHEVLIRYVAAGLCHSDEHLRTEGFWGGTARHPMVGGHEGAGVVEAVGPGVASLEVGDHVVCSFLPACGHCRWCSTGHQNLCDVGALLMQGCQVDGTFRYHDADGLDYGGSCMLGTFSQYGVVSEYSAVRVGKDLPLEKAVLVGCGVTTGWGSAVYTAQVGPGDTVLVYGIGGVGINAVQGAAHAGAKNVIAVDPVELKRTKASELGATHTASTAEEAHELVQSLTHGVGADQAIITTGVVESATVSAAVEAIRKAGSVTITGLAALDDHTVDIPSMSLTLFEKRIQGSLFGSANPFADIPKLLDLYRSGHLKLDEVVTREYRLEQINEAYADMHSGKNVRGVIVF